MVAESPLVSIVITTLDRLTYLQGALATVAAQTYPHFEVIVLDDGSSDGTVDFLAQFSPSFRFRFESHLHRERSFLRNEGVRISSGDLICFLDDDDAWLPEKLERQVAFISARPEAGMVYCFTLAMDANGIPIDDLTETHEKTYRRHLKTGHGYANVAESCLIFTSSVMVRRDVFTLVGGFREDFVGAEDWDLYLKLARFSKIALLPEALVRYRLHSGNSASEPDRRVRVGDARIRAAESHLNNLQSNDVKNRRAVSALLNSIAQNHYWSHRDKDALKYCGDALRASPATFFRPTNLTLLLKAAIKSMLQ